MSDPTDGEVQLQLAMFAVQAFPRAQTLPNMY